MPSSRGEAFENSAGEEKEKRSGSGTAPFTAMPLPLSTAVAMRANREAGGQGGGARSVRAGSRIPAGLRLLRRCFGGDEYFGWPRGRRGRNGRVRFSARRGEESVPGFLPGPGAPVAPAASSSRSAGRRVARPPAAGAVGDGAPAVPLLLGFGVHPRSPADLPTPGGTAQPGFPALGGGRKRGSAPASGRLADRRRKAFRLFPEQAVTGFSVDRPAGSERISAENPRGAGGARPAGEFGYSVRESGRWPRQGREARRPPARGSVRCFPQGARKAAGSGTGFG